MRQSLSIVPLQIPCNIFMFIFFSSGYQRYCSKQVRTTTVASVPTQYIYITITNTGVIADGDQAVILMGLVSGFLVLVGIH